MGAKQTTWTLPPEPASVAFARHRIIDLLEACGWDDHHIGDAALMSTELITNAVEHAATSFTVSVHAGDDTLRVEVCDENEVPPVAAPVRLSSSIGGRGLRIVTALADHWGYEPTAQGKSVWFETTR